VRVERSRDCLHYYADAGSSTGTLSLTPWCVGKVQRGLGRTPRIGMAEDAPSGFLDYARNERSAIYESGMLMPHLQNTLQLNNYVSLFIP